MANKAISELPQAQNVNNQDLFVLEQSGIAKKLPAETFITEQGIINALAEALDGHGGIQSVTLSSVSGRIRTYRITFTDQSATTFQVYDGTSIDRISRTSSSGLDDVYTIFLSDGTTTFFTVHNGADGTVSEAMLNDALKDKAPAITETTESSAIANFPDGADDMVMHNVVAEINPVQDLTYGDPYPAGSKNQLIFKTISGNIESNGKIVSTSDFHLLVAKVTASQTYVYSADGVVISSGVIVLAFFSSEPEIGSVAYDGQRITTGQNPFVAPIDGYVAIRVASSSDVRRQIEAGSTATAYYPYSNICPITGWTECNVTRTGKNLLEVTAESVTTKGVTFTVNSDGSVLVDGTATETVSFYLNSALQLPNGSFILSGCPSGGSSSNGYSLQGSGGPPYDVGAGSSSFSEITGRGIRIRIASGVSCNNLLFKPMIRLASDTDSAYEPYQGTTLTVDWQTEAGTVYGGTIDVATGLLTVDRAMVDLGTLSWDKVGTSPAFYAPFSANPDRSGDVYGYYYVSSAFKYGAEASKLWNGTQEGLCVEPTSISGTPRIYVRMAIYDSMTAADFKTAMSGVQLVYELATPQTYQLTPQEVIKTLYGNNTVWADTGNVTVTYPADTKMFIEKLTMPTEDDLVANQAITSGKYFMVGNSLYLALANIASGAQITIGTNAQRVSLADALNTINS